jgi:hypothetical protein
MKCKIDENYITNFKSFINTIGYTSVHAYGSLHKNLQSLINCEIQPKQRLHTRSNNVDTNFKQRYLNGKIACGVIIRHHRENYNHNVLLPNGDVVLCCMDYGLKHRLGNLLINKYEDLFKSENYITLMNGLENENIEILCRTCSEAILA